MEILLIWTAIILFFILCCVKYYFDNKKIYINNLNYDMTDECEELAEDMNELFHDFEER